MSSNRLQPIAPAPQPGSPERDLPPRQPSARTHTDDSRRLDDSYRSDRDEPYRRDDRDRRRREYDGSYDGYDPAYASNGHGQHRRRDSRSRSPPRRGEYHDDRDRRSSSQPRGRQTLPPGDYSPRRRSRSPRPPSRSPPRPSGIIRRGETSDAEEPEIDDDPELIDMTPSERLKDLMATIRRHQKNKWNIPNKRSLAGQLQKYARYVPRKFGPFNDLGRVVQAGVMWEGGPPPRWRVPEASLSAILKVRLTEEKECLEVFEWLKNTVVYFADIVPLLSRKGQGQDVITLGAFLDTHARQARASDKRSIFEALALYVGALKISDNLTIPAPVGVQATHKDFLGLESNWATAQLIRPDALLEFEADPTGYRLLIRGNTIRIDHNDNPVFLYDMESYDPDNLLEGLLRNPALLKALRNIFTSPGSVHLAPGMKSAGRGSISHIYKTHAVEPRMIAYVATLVRNILSSCPRWAEDDGAFKGRLFFRRLVNLFDPFNDPEDTWATDTLAWWNANVYGDDISNRNPNARRPGGALSDDEILQQQRAARAAARAAAAAQPGPTIEEQPNENPAPSAT